MALKRQRKVIDTSIDFFMNQTAERGAVATVSTGGSGVAMDSSVHLVQYKSSASGGKPVGILLCDVVNKDLTQMKQNLEKEEVQVGGKVTLLLKGEVTTNMIVSGVSPAAGDDAYLGGDGRITNVNTGATASPRVGRFITSKDELGFARVAVNLP